MATAPVHSTHGTGSTRVRRAVGDSLTITRRHMIHWVREPADIIIGLLVPIMIVLVFGYVFGGAMTAPGDGDYIDYLMPGMFVLAMLQSIGGTGFSVADDMRKGVTDRFRSMPMAPSAMVSGRSIADLFRGTLDMALLVACGLLIGWRIGGSLPEAAAAMGLLLLLRFALIWVAIYLGMALPTPDSVGVAVYPLTFPLTALSSAFVSPAMMPGWIAAPAEWNPLSATVNATRALFGAPVAGGQSWGAQHPLLMAVVWPLLIIAVFAPLSIRRYRRLSR